jgi:hypothetical protein
MLHQNWGCYPRLCCISFRIHGDKINACVIRGITMNPTVRKLLYVSLWYVVYPQLVYLWLIPGVFKDLLLVSVLVVSYVVGFLDTYFRPFSDSISEDWGSGAVYNLIMLGLFIFHPFLVTLAFNENQWFTTPLWDNVVVSVTGILITVIGGVITVTGRAQLSRFGSGIIQITRARIIQGIFSGLLPGVCVPGCLRFYLF